MYDKALREYNDKGFTVLSEFCSVEEIKALEADLKKFIKIEAPNITGRKINYSDKNINSIHCLHEYPDYFFCKLASSKKILKLARVLLDDDPEFKGIEAFLKPAGCGLQSPMHQDDYYWSIDSHNGLTMWLALDYCDEENGGITYIEKSNHFGLLDHEKSFAPGSSQMIKDKTLLLPPNNKVTPTLNIGDMVIHHALTIHGSKDNQSNRSRRGITFQFKAKNCKYDLSRQKNYEKELLIQLKNRDQKD